MWDAEQLLLSQSQEGFTIQLWRDAVNKDAWHGQVRDVTTGQVMVIPDPAELLHCIQKQADQHRTAPAKARRGLR